MGGFKVSRWQHYKWFFEFIWWSIKDFFTHPIECIKYKLVKENWGDFNTRIDFDTDPELLEITRQLSELKHDNDNKASDI